MRLFIPILSSRRLTGGQQIKIILKAWFFFAFQRDEDGWHWFVRTPLFMIESKKNWWDYLSLMECRVSGGGVAFWPRLPLREGDYIYRWQKSWFE